MIRRLLYIFFLLLLFYGNGQTAFRFKNLTINDGLSQSSVTTIVQDEVNALWIGTQDGLNRYDGKSFEVFTSDKTEGLESEFILCSVKDVDGNLWFGTRNGLTCFDLEKETFKTYKTSSNTYISIYDIEIDQNGMFWLASLESGLFSFDPKTSTFKSYSFLFPSRRIANVEVGDNGQVLVATEDQGLFFWKQGSKKADPVPVERKSNTLLSINKIIYQGAQRFFLATNQGAFELDASTKKSTPLFAELDADYGLQNIADAYQANDIGWIICTKNNGLFVIDEEGKINHSTEDIFQKSALLFNELNTIYKDRSGTFWVGSQRGISSFNPKQRGILGVGPSGNSNKGIPSASVWSFAEDENGTVLFIGTDKAVTKYDKETGNYYQYPRIETSVTHGSGEMAVLDIQIMDKNKLLVGCADGLFLLTTSGSDYVYKQLLVKGESVYPHNRVYSIIHWKDHLYWVATKDGALLYNSNLNKLEAFEYNNKNIGQTISKGVCRLVYKDKNNRVWFTTSTGGLNLLTEVNGKPQIHPYEHNYQIKSICSDYITSIYQEANGIYWFGTSGSGLMRWDERSKEGVLFNKKMGLPNDVVYGVLPGKDRTLWLSTNRGLSNFDMQTHKTTNYSEVDGLMSNEFNIGAYMKSATGDLYFGGIYGYNYFNPDDVLMVEKDLSVVFTRFKLENEWLKPNMKGSPLTKPVYLTETIKLGYKQRSFTLRFQPSDLSHPDLVNYKYVLEGSDDGEILLGTMNEVHFSALSHGSYVLKVYARIGDGEWSSTPATIQVTIQAPFWLTWWFWLIFLVVLAISVRVFIRYRIDASRREQVRLEMKIRARTKEIQLQNKKIESQKKKIEEEKNKVLRQQKLLQIEKDKTEKLLRNVMPESTAEELKKSGKARARAYKTVSVLFTDFVGFTKISDRMNPTELVKKLDVYFTKFDEIIVRNNLEKIKTIGDAYMCAGGVPVRNNTNPIDACLAALQIQDYMSKRKHDAIANGKEYWELRLGINTGEVTAGVIGSERLAYDIWGATVNQAQRMEMLGEPGKVTITGDTFKHIEPYFECTFMGKAQSKSRGIIDMFVVERIKPELSENGKGIKPNSRFHQIVNLHHYSSINYYKAERHIMKVLDQRLAKNLYYHSISHTKDVVSAVERLALLEDVTDEGLFLLKSAATYHDAGFVEQYEKNEPIGARLAEEILPKYGYTEKHIEQIKELIYVTQIPHQPKNKLEEIICDADLDYLGRDDFHEIADRLKRELMEYGKVKSDKEWDMIQVKFLRQHRYFTKTAIESRVEKKKKNLQEVLDRLERDEYK